MAKQTLRTLLPAAPECLVDAPSEWGAEPSFPTQSPLPGTQNDSKFQFACPFYKLDPNVYQDCRRFGISRVKDMKPHLQRKHSSQASYG